MELEDSLPCSQDSTTGPYLEPDESSQYYHILSLFNISVNEGCCLLGLVCTFAFCSGFEADYLSYRHTKQSYANY
jgi:hypothetical protein